MNTTPETKPSNFVRNIIDGDLASGKNGGKVVTRFPPEPNGYLHIGHAKSICLNFGIAEDYPNARCHLRFDDTNPIKEEDEYVESIKEDVQWLGFDWDEHLYFASDYYDTLYEYAVMLIKIGKAFVCSLSADEMRDYRGTLTEPGKPSPDRDRSIEENLDLFGRMKAGEFEPGEYVLRAKIDMNSPNINMRDPVIYRIMDAIHHRTGDKWKIYPMYDYAHPLSDMLEGITHSICTLEFEDHRPLYDWLLETLDTPCHPQQIEFARLNLTYTIMSKRKLLELVKNDYVHGWDDPRMPTISGMRRRGFPPEAIRDLCERVGVTKKDSMIDMELLEHCVRENLDQNCERRIAVIDPLKVVITNYPKEEEEWVEISNHPKRPELGTRKVPLSHEIYIERDDFMEEPPAKYFRLSPGKSVRLRNAFVITCDDVIKNSKTGEVMELRCSYNPDTRHGNTPEGMAKVKGIIHWVSAKHAIPHTEVRLYDRLFTEAEPEAKKEIDYKTFLNPHSLTIKENVMLEPCLVTAEPGERFQFERVGYFVVDYDRDLAGKPTFNRIVELRGNMKF